MKNNFIFKIFCIIFYIFIIFSFRHISVASANVWYVDTNIVGSGDGTNWGLAFKYIEEAIDTASNGDEIWVKEGIYYISKVLVVDKTIAIYGGFPGDLEDPNMADRDWVTNLTTIDGHKSDEQESIVHCFDLKGDVTIDGLVITGGKSTDDDPEPDYGGSGIFIYNSSNNNTIRNCIILANQSMVWGAGVLILESSNNSFEKCTFSLNKAIDESGAPTGGAIAISKSSNTVITDCTFSENGVGGYGGAIHNVDSSTFITDSTFQNNNAKYSAGAICAFGGTLTITNCMFTENQATDKKLSKGGAISIYLGGSITISDCLFSGNSAAGYENIVYDDNSGEVRMYHAAGGGAIYIDESCSPTITNCEFIGNRTTSELQGLGGAILNNIESSAIITNCIFTGNSVNGFGCGGAIHNNSASPTITNNIFAGNLAGSNGGAISNKMRIASFIPSMPDIINCTFTGNIAEDYGGGIYNEGSNPNLTNCIFWDDISEQEESNKEIYNDDESLPLVTYCNIDQDDYIDNNCNIRQNPLFIADGFWNDNETSSDTSDDIWEDGNYHLQIGSPCIDSGDPNFDFLYELEPNGCRINMGAFGNTTKAQISSDFDKDGIYGDCDNCPNIFNPAQDDNDNDGVGDVCDNCPYDPNKTEEGVCGCGEPDIDTDSDGTFDCLDACPYDPDKTEEGVCGCGEPDIDSDNDGTLDCNDDFPYDPNEWVDTDKHGSGNQSPDPPVLLFPEDGAIDVILSIVLETDDFSDPDYDIHTETEWQISTDESDFSADSLVLALKSDSHLTTLEIPKFIININTLYYWRVRFYDDPNNHSDWSETSSFKTIIYDVTDSDGDGIKNDQEVDGSIDMDNDGTPDINQTDIKSVNTVVGDGQIGVKAGNNVDSIEAVSSIDPNTIPDNDNKPDIIPLGLVSFKIEVKNAGDIGEAIVFLSEPASLNAKWYHFDSIYGWRIYPYATFSADRTSVTLEFKDGDVERGDIDGTENRIIIDPGGIGITSTANPSITPSTVSGGGGCFIATINKCR